ncbi:hypothetical protein [Streptomyces sp. SAS_270]|uniref:hypothetical protein n=1 Tax=Streptomyces sp. SAS_270 TaxID=3412748 RepID=UPI00403C829E
MGAALGALAAIGGLVFTAVATYYSAVVSQDQLQQSREDAERERRSQAMRVSLWTEDQVANNMRLHIMNRSPDPVTDVSAGFLVRKGAWGDDSADEPGRYGGLYVDLPNLPPCSEMIVKPESLRWHVPNGTSPRELPADARVFIEWMGFVDRDSNRWLRQDGALLPFLENVPDGVTKVEVRPDSREEGTVPILAFEPNGEVDGRLPMQRAASCEDN